MTRVVAGGLAVVLLAAACAPAGPDGGAGTDGGSASAGPAEAPRIAVSFTPDPPAVGPASLQIALADASGQPIEDARIEVEGNMSHAGMVPVTGRARGGEDGRYTVPLELTMAGDWFFLLEVTLPDGATVEHRVDARVVPRS